MIIVAFDGMDGSGKTTIIEKIKDVGQEEHGLNIGTYKFPNYNDPETGDIIRDYLNGNLYDISSVDIRKYFAINRVNSMKDIVSLKECCDLLLLDRYTLSNPITHVPLLNDMFGEGADSIYSEAGKEFESTSSEHRPIVPDMTYVLYRDPKEAYVQITKERKVVHAVETLKNLKRMHTIIKVMENVYPKSMTYLQENDNVTTRNLPPLYHLFGYMGEVKFVDTGTDYDFMKTIKHNSDESTINIIDDILKQGGYSL